MKPADTSPQTGISRLAFLKILGLGASGAALAQVGRFAPPVIGEGNAEIGVNPELGSRRFVRWETPARQEVEGKVTPPNPNRFNPEGSFAPGDYIGSFEVLSLSDHFVVLVPVDADKNRLITVAPQIIDEIILGSEDAAAVFRQCGVEIQFAPGLLDESGGPLRTDQGSIPTPIIIKVLPYEYQDKSLPDVFNAHAIDGGKYPAEYGDVAYVDGDGSFERPSPRASFIQFDIDANPDEVISRIPHIYRQVAGHEFVHNAQQLLLVPLPPFAWESFAAAFDKLTEGEVDQIHHQHIPEILVFYKLNRGCIHFPSSYCLYEYWLNLARFLSGTRSEKRVKLTDLYLKTQLTLMNELGEIQKSAQFEGVQPYHQTVLDELMARSFSLIKRTIDREIPQGGGVSVAETATALTLESSLMATLALTDDRAPYFGQVRGLSTLPPQDDSTSTEVHYPLHYSLVENVNQTYVVVPTVLGHPLTKADERIRSVAPIGPAQTYYFMLDSRAGNELLRRRFLTIEPSLQPDPEGNVEMRRCQIQVLVGSTETTSPYFISAEPNDPSITIDLEALPTGASVFIISQLSKDAPLHEMSHMSAMLGWDAYDGYPISPLFSLHTAE